jgi:hypothetical protein
MNAPQITGLAGNPRPAAAPSLARTGLARTCPPVPPCPSGSTRAA